MLTAACPDAVRLLIDTMGDPSVKRDLRIDCANTIIERVLGKAAQPILAEVHRAEAGATLSEMMASLWDLMEK